MSCHGKSWEASWRQWPLGGALEPETTGKGTGGSEELKGPSPGPAPYPRAEGSHRLMREARKRDQNLYPCVTTLKIKEEAKLNCT